MLHGPTTSPKQDGQVTIDWSLWNGKPKMCLSSWLSQVFVMTSENRLTSTLTKLRQTEPAVECCVLKCCLLHSQEPGLGDRAFPAQRAEAEVSWEQKQPLKSACQKYGLLTWTVPDLLSKLLSLPLDNTPIFVHSPQQLWALGPGFRNLHWAAHRREMQLPSLAHILRNSYSYFFFLWRF